MDTPTQGAAGNFLLERCTSDDFRRLAPHCVPLALPVGTVLQTPGERLAHVHFLRSGLASVVVAGRQGEQVDLGLIGREGMCGRSNGVDFAEINLRVEMSIAGSSWAIPVEEFSMAMDEQPSLILLLTRFFYVFHLQVTQTLLTTARFTIPQRLARLLLMCQDRVGTELEITHGQLAQMLAIRRAGVTQALQLLEGSHALRSVRGSIRILDRAQLIELSDGTYGGPERAFELYLPPHGAASSGLGGIAGQGSA